MCVYPISPFQLHCTLIFQKKESMLTQRFALKNIHGWHWHFLRQRREAEAIVIILWLLSLFVVVVIFWKYLFNIKMEMLGRQFDRWFGQLKKKVSMDILIWESFYEITYKWMLIEKRLKDWALAQCPGFSSRESIWNLDKKRDPAKRKLGSGQCEKREKE